MLWFESIDLLHGISPSWIQDVCNKAYFLRFCWEIRCFFLVLIAYFGLLGSGSEEGIVFKSVQSPRQILPQGGSQLSNRFWVESGLSG